MAVMADPLGLPTLRRYVLLEKIGVGSMAVVYKARRRASGALVALKVPRPSVVGHPVLLERFRQEFAVGNQLKRPNLVRALEFGQEAETFYLAMEYVDGQ